MQEILLNTAYLPPVQYISKIKSAEIIHIEQHDHYNKQSYRNRCDIMTANGVMALSVPVKKGETLKSFTKEILIDYATPWQKLHFKGIESAYKKSPFYDYYIDDLLVYFQRKEKYLLDLNLKLLSVILDLIPLKRQLQLTDEYIKEHHSLQDYRDVIHPKSSRRVRTDDYVPKPYHQTFAEKFPFTPNLSILDLLFNAGPETTIYL